MTDILTRLQAPHGYFGRSARFEAAREIEGLRAALASLKAALRDGGIPHIKTNATELSMAYQSGYEAGKHDARAAIEGEKK